MVKQSAKIGDVINGFKIIERKDTNFTIKDPHIYWTCQCITCGSIITIPSNRLKTRKCDKCRENNRLHDFNFSRRENFMRGIYYRNNLQQYEVHVSYKNEKHFLGSYRNKEQAINISKISYSFKNEDNLFVWFLNYKDIYDNIINYFTKIMENINFTFSDFIDCIWEMESADALIDKKSMELLIDDYAQAFTDI